MTKPNPSLSPSIFLSLHLSLSPLSSVLPALPIFISLCKFGRLLKRQKMASLVTFADIKESAFISVVQFTSVNEIHLCWWLPGGPSL